MLNSHAYLQKYCTQNNFPVNFVSKIFRKILYNMYNPKPIYVSAVKKPVYFHFPYMGKSSFEIKLQCTSSYISQTGKQLKIRISQHKGRSFRTDQLLTCHEFSNICNHAHDTNHSIRNCNFKILDTCNSFDLRLLESI